MGKHGHKGSLGVPAIIIKKDRRQVGKEIPQDFNYRYKCLRRHERVESSLIEDKPLPFCGKCHMTTGEMNRIEYAGRVKRPTIRKK
jgi:hypothetical protein